jgi:hypothetical protein
MKQPKKPQTVNLKIRISPSQNNALKREAKRRKITTAALLREQIGVLTGVEDPLQRQARHGEGKRRKSKTITT